MTLRLLDHAEAWVTEAKVKINAALTYLDGLQASITAEIAAAISAAFTAFLAADNTFSGDNTFTGNLDLTGATSTGTAAAQTYDEGTFTPGIAFGGGTTGLTYTTQAASYTRIGRLVHVTIHILLSAKGSSTGSATVTGLPFTVGSTSPAVFFIGGMTAGVGDTYVEAIFMAGGTSLQLFDIAAGTFAALTDVDFTNTSRLRISGAYEI